MKKTAPHSTGESQEQIDTMNQHGKPGDDQARGVHFEHCPKCNVSFDGGPIPENIREHYSPPYRWSRKIGIYCRDRDRTVAYRCPDCEYEWDRK